MWCREPTIGHPRDVPRAPEWPLRNHRYLIASFRTEYLGRGDDPNTIQHQVAWGCYDHKRNKYTKVKYMDPGLLTREHVSWKAAPSDFGATQNSAYRRDGEHFGEAYAAAQNGGNKDNHSIYPYKPTLDDVPDFKPRKIERGTRSKTFVMEQSYQIGHPAVGWVDIPEARYRLKRWFVRTDDNRLVMHMKKEGRNGRANEYYERTYDFGTPRHWRR